MDLSCIPTPVLERLQAAVAAQRVSFPLTRFAMQAEGFEELMQETQAHKSRGARLDGA